MVFLPAKSCGHSRTRCADSPFVFKNQTARFTAHMCADTDNRLCHGADCLPPSQPERATWDMVQTSTNHCTAKQEWTECCPRIRSTAEATYACFDTSHCTGSHRAVISGSVERHGSHVVVSVASMSLHDRCARGRFLWD